MSIEILKLIFITAAAALACATAWAAPVESKPIEITFAPAEPVKSEWERQRERAAERDKALKVQESRRLSAKVNRRRYLLNEAAANIKVAASLTGEPTRAEVDFKTGDITIHFADGYKFVQRIDKTAFTGRQLYRKANGKKRPKKKGGNNVR
jgi:hypothetical protein